MTGGWSRQGPARGPLFAHSRDAVTVRLSARPLIHLPPGSEEKAEQAKQAFEELLAEAPTWDVISTRTEARRNFERASGEFLLTVERASTEHVTHDVNFCAMCPKVWPST